MEQRTASGRARAFAEDTARFCGQIVAATSEYVTDLVSALDFRDSLPFACPVTGRSAAKAPAPPASGVGSAPGVRELHLSGAAGSEAKGLFVVENNLLRPISGAVMASDFTNAAGESVDLALSFVPERIELQPQGRLVVEVTAHLDEDVIAAGATYSGLLTVPGLPGSQVPVAIAVEPDSPGSD